MEKRDEDLSVNNLLELVPDTLGVIFNNFSISTALNFELTSAKCKALLNSATVANKPGFWKSTGFEDKFEHRDGEKAKQILSERRSVGRFDRARERLVMTIYCLGDLPLAEKTADLKPVIEGRELLVSDKFSGFSSDITGSVRLFVIFAQNQHDFDRVIERISKNTPVNLIPKYSFFVIASPANIQLDTKGIHISAKIELEFNKETFANFCKKTLEITESAEKGLDTYSSLSK